MYGRSGAGKTSLLARASAIAAAGWRPTGAVTVVRFCGTSRGSSDARSMLVSVCRQLARALGPASGAGAAAGAAAGVVSGTSAPAAAAAADGAADGGNGGEGLGGDGAHESDGALNEDASLKEATAAFSALLSRATAARPVRVFIDSLDQLDRWVFVVIGPPSLRASRYPSAVSLVRLAGSARQVCRDRAYMHCLGQLACRLY